MNFKDRLLHAWNAFKGDNSYSPPANDTTIYSNTSMRPRIYKANQSRFSSAIFTRIAIDVAMTQFNHVKINKSNDDLTVLDSGLQYCLTREANTDQTSIAFLHDVVFSLLDEGCIAVVPIDTTINPKVSGSFDVLSMRVAKIIGWTNNSVQVNVYDEHEGRYKQIWLPKKAVAIIESPLYYVINEPNSTLQRLLRKMAILDSSDNAYAVNRLDIILQTPQSIRTDVQKENAKKRIQDIDDQLSVGNNGIAYIDATERITQLNRPSNSQIAESIDKLKAEFYNQLGLTQAIFDGTATEAQLRSYYNRTIDPIIAFIVQELERKFLTKTARTQGQAIETYRDTLKFVSAEQLISLGDTMRRNEIATSNEIRKIIGMKRSNDAKADKLDNPNIAPKKQVGSATRGEGEHTRDNQNGYNSVSNKEE